MKVVWDVVKAAARHASIEKLAPHDLRRTWARLCTSLVRTRPHVTSYDVFLTTAGDVLIATGLPSRTPVLGEPGEFISHGALTVVGGSGKYADATGTMTFDGTGHTGTVPPTADFVYKIGSTLSRAPYSTASRKRKA